MTGEPEGSLDRERELFLEALERATPAERASFLAEACGGDAALRARLESLLRHHLEDNFLEQPAPLAHPEPGPEAAGGEGIGTVIGRYKLLEKLGEGGCGVVYLAEQEQPVRRRVALKVIKLGMDTREVMARFDAERQALALMDHPNIARIFDAGVIGGSDSQPSTLHPPQYCYGGRVNPQLSSGRPYFVMELVRGLKITDFCDQNSLSTQERLNLFGQVCRAVQHAHQKGIIHRDLKPANILVTSDDGVPTPKVIDFGIAKATQGRLTDQTVFTAIEQFLGTPAYMSPEQAQMSAADVDTRSDIYSLGVLLYELLTGKTPFDSKELLAAGLDEMRRTIREKEPARPSTRLSTMKAGDLTAVAQRRQAEPPKLISVVRGDLDWIVMKCLEKDRARRYETANGLAADIQRHLDNEPVVASPPGKFYRFQKLVRRNKLVFAAAAAVAGALVVGLGVSSWLFLKEQAARKRAAAAEKVQIELRQQAQAEATKSQQVAQFLKDMLQSVGPSVALGRDTTLLKEILDNTAKRVGRDLKTQPEVEVELRNTIGQVYSELGDYQAAEAMHRQALAMARTLPRTGAQETATSLHYLARTLLLSKRNAEAEAPEREAVALRKEVLGPKSPQVAVSLDMLAMILDFQGRSAEAEPVEREAVAIQKKVGTDRMREGAEALNNLGVILTDEGKLAEAESVLQQALVTRKALFSSEHPDVAESYGQLGNAFRREGKLAEAEASCREALTMQRKLYGTEHPITRQMLRDLTGVLQNEGKHAEAEELCREALATARKSTKASGSTAVADLLQILAAVLRREGKQAEAEASYREALLIKRNLLGIEDPLTRGSLRALTSMLEDEGKQAEAEELCREALAAARKSTKASGSTAVVDLLEVLATLVRDEGKPAEAEPLFREGMELSRPFSTKGLWVVLGLADVLRRQNKLAQAESLCGQYLEAVQRLPPSLALAWALTVLADVLREEGKPAEAETRYRAGLGIVRNVVTNDDGVHLWLASGMAVILRDQEKWAEAEALYDEALTNAARIMAISPGKWEQWQLQVANLALVLDKQGKLAEEEALYWQAVTNAAGLWPHDFARWQWQSNSLVNVLQRQGKTNDVERLRQELARIAMPSQR